jgi:hypothetical protein
MRKLQYPQLPQWLSIEDDAALPVLAPHPSIRGITAHPKVEDF